MSVIATLSKNDLFQTAPRVSGQAVRLFCVPHAGAGASAFRGWPAALGAEIETIVIQMPGRETRFSADAYLQLETLVDDLAEAVLPHLEADLPFAFFGNSFGALVAFETLHAIRRRSGREAAHLFVSAKGAPHLPLLLPPIGDLNDRELADAVGQRYGALPAVLLEDEGYLAMVLRALRADLLMLESYERRTPDPLRCPVTVFSGALDRTLLPEQIGGWSEQTTGAFRSLEIPDEGHLYLQSARALLTETIRRSLLEPAGC